MIISNFNSNKYRVLTRVHNSDRQRNLSGIWRCTVLDTHWKQAYCLWFSTLVIAFVFTFEAAGFSHKCLYLLTANVWEKIN